jgi:uncharacterized protein YlxW (UPF0749 family)
MSEGWLLTLCAAVFFTLGVLWRHGTVSKLQCREADLNAECDRLVRGYNRLVDRVNRAETTVVAVRTENEALTDELAIACREIDMLRPQIAGLAWQRARTTGRPCLPPVPEAIAHLDWEA